MREKNFLPLEFGKQNALQSIPFSSTNLFNVALTACLLDVNFRFRFQIRFVIMQVDQFAEAVQKTTDPEQLAEAFYEAVRKQAIAVNRSQGADSAEFIALEREARLFSLVQTVRAAQLDSLVERHAKVLSWLMEMQIKPQEPEELTATKWLHTTAQVRAAGLAGQSAGSLGGIHALDPDAPVRESATIAPDDASADKAVFAYIFELLLAGQRVLASRVCSSTNNWQLQALVDSEITALTAAACYAVAATPHLSKQERAVYGFLAGDVASSLPLCTTWEQRLIVMLNALVRSERLGGAQTKLALPKCPYNNLSDIFAALELNGGDGAPDFLHRIMAAVIADRMGAIAAEVAREIELVANGPENVTADPNLVRIAVHLILIAPAGSVAASDAEVIIDAYCGYLEMLEKWHWLPGYVRVLSHDALVRVYGRGLAQIATAPARQLQLQLAAKFKLPITECVRKAVELILEQNAAVFVADTTEEQFAGDPLQLVAAVEWLRDAQLWDDAASTAVSIMRAFLVQENIAAALQLCRTTSLLDVAERAESVSDAVKTELRRYAVLAQALEAIDRCSDDGNKEAALTAAHAATVAARELAVAPETPALVALQTKYVPVVILEALRVLLSAQLYDQALEIAVLVADEHLRLYGLFTASGRLPELLQGLARAELKNW